MYASAKGGSITSYTIHRKWSDKMISRVLKFSPRSTSLGKAPITNDWFVLSSEAQSALFCCPHLPQQGQVNEHRQTQLSCNSQFFASHRQLTLPQRKSSNRPDKARSFDCIAYLAFLVKQIVDTFVDCKLKSLSQTFGRSCNASSVPRALHALATLQNNLSFANATEPHATFSANPAGDCLPTQKHLFCSPLRASSFLARVRQR